MHTLTLRIYLTVVAVLTLFAFASGWIFKHQVDEERQRVEMVVAERLAGWGELISRSLPGPETPLEDQSAALLAWSRQLHMPMALESSRGQRIAASESFVQGEGQSHSGAVELRLDDGRTLRVMRPGRIGKRPGSRAPSPGWTAFSAMGWQPGVGLVLVLMVLFVAVAAGAWPAVGRLTRRLKALKQGVEKFGSGHLHQRVEVSGRDEVAAVAASFNQAAERIEALVRSHQSLLANASHELRSPLARLKMAVSMMNDASSSAQNEKLKREVDANVAELDALVEEVLLASRLEGGPKNDCSQAPVDLLALAAEEAARVDAAVGGIPVTVPGDERLLRRALRNLLENARRYGAGAIEVSVGANEMQAVVQVSDEGPGVPANLRDRIFEPFYRLPGHAEQAGGVGLGLSLVKQIAERHGGQVNCLAREGGGGCFELSLPLLR